MLHFFGKMQKMQLTVYYLPITEKKLAGLMAAPPVAKRDWVDARITKIYAGTNEIMKELIGRTMGL